MMIMLHVGIALMSLIVGVMAVASSSYRILRVSYGLIVATVVSGSVLLVMSPAKMLHVCISGLSYLALASALTLVARHRIRHGIQRETTD